MALLLTGLGHDDVAEIVECLLLGSAHAAQGAPGLADRRRELADMIGDALDAVPTAQTPGPHHGAPTAPSQKGI
ncbi:hypothetical protein ACFVXE_08120 [Streptomyces sp. NPDC058231]|uniref:hypothetical protein n=1 Tax=Streptomyces sp. NPDC058231 TaxID=3346392 RepID=UPI0036E01179